MYSGPKRMPWLTTQLPHGQTMKRFHMLLLGRCNLLQSGQENGDCNVSISRIPTPTKKIPRDNLLANFTSSHQQAELPKDNGYPKIFPVLFRQHRLVIIGNF